MGRNVKWVLARGLVLALLGTAGCGGAANTGVAETPPDSAVDSLPSVADPNSNSDPESRNVFLWKATLLKNPEKTLYLMGSVHVANEDFYPLDPVIEEAYAQSEALVVEVDTTKISEAEQVQLVLKKASLPNGEFLKDRLTEETCAKLEAGLAKFNIQYDRIKNFKPWFAGMTFVTLRITAAGFRPEMGIDHYFLSKGDKDVFGLETAESQLSLFDDMTEPLENLFLQDALESPLQLDYFNLIMDTWARGDAAGLEEIIFKAVEERPEFGPLYDRVFDLRNHAMAKGIGNLQEQHDTLFVVVGAGHMVGPEGLVAIFKNKGYEVTQLTKKR